MNGYDYNNDKLIDVTDYNVSWIWSAGAISSNLENSLKFARLAVGKHVLLNKNATKQQRTFNKLEDSMYFKLPTYYGFHLMKIDNFLGHSGSIPGYTSYILYSPCTETNLVVAINLQSNNRGIFPTAFITEYIISRLNNKTTLFDAKKLIKK